MTLTARAGERQGFSVPSNLSVLTPKSGATASTGRREAGLYTDHIASEVSGHCLQGLERQGVNISDNALVRHNLVVFRNGDSAMQVSTDFACLFKPLACHQAGPTLSTHPTGLSSVTDQQASGAPADTGVRWAT